ncbi:MAG: phosphatidate cytidylyltransferase [Anaerolineae bacterium]|jgi:phosphatidate cytidylyltransferase|nr:phosphatidate cytidylyltransferase [Anaerolineae bacterium]
MGHARDHTHRASPPLKLNLSRNFVTRALTALTLVPITVGAMAIGGWVFTLLVLFFFTLANLELLTILTRQHLSVGAAAGVILALPAALSFAHTPDWPIIFGLVGIAIFALDLYLPHEGERSIQRALGLAVMALTMAMIAGCAIALRNNEGGLAWWLLVVIATWGTDTLAYAGGRAYGRTPLLPSWSPNKTREGALTGLVGAMILGVITLWVLNAMFPLTLTIVIGAPFAAVIGDLVESKLKRLYNVKDSYIKGLNLVPGHGGLLDRIDSLLLVILFVYLTVMIFSL